MGFTSTPASPSSSPSTTSIADRAQLGQMPSMSPECTPLKHRYDSCFNRWFEDYLGLSSSFADSKTRGSRDTKGTSRFFGGGNSSSSTEGSGGSGFGGNTLGGRGVEDSSQRSSLKDRLEGECGAFWKEYQQCVQRAVKEKGLEGLISEARAHNPFPFPQDRPTDKPHNEPFPFPAAEGGR